MFLLPENIETIGMKTTKKSWKHHFRHYKSMGVFLDIQGQVTLLMWSNLVKIRTPLRHIR